MALQVNLTYEKIFDTLMREKSREDLQRVDETFYQDVSSYIVSKQELISTDDSGSMLIQVQNIKRMLKELYERREKKIVNMAIIASRTSPSFIDIANMTSAEKELFEQLFQKLDDFRAKLLNVNIVIRKPFKETVRQPKIVVAQEPEEEDSIAVEKVNSSAGGGVFMHVRFVTPVSKFVGRELEVYGPFEIGQTAQLPLELGQILISNNSAVEV